MGKHVRNTRMLLLLKKKLKFQLISKIFSIISIFLIAWSFILTNLNILFTIKMSIRDQTTKLICNTSTWTKKLFLIFWLLVSLNDILKENLNCLFCILFYLGIFNCSSVFWRKSCDCNNLTNASGAQMTLEFPLWNKFCEINVLGANMTGSFC